MASIIDVLKDLAAKINSLPSLRIAQSVGTTPASFSSNMNTIRSSGQILLVRDASPYGCPATHVDTYIRRYQATRMACLSHPILRQASNTGTSTHSASVDCFFWPGTSLDTAPTPAQFHILKCDHFFLGRYLERATGLFRCEEYPRNSS